MTNGRPRADGVQPARRAPSSASAAQHPARDVDAGGAQPVGAAAGEPGAGRRTATTTRATPAAISASVHGAGAAGVGARLERDDGGAAPGPRARPRAGRSPRRAGRRAVRWPRPPRRRAAASRTTRRPAGSGSSCRARRRTRRAPGASRRRGSRPSPACRVGVAAGSCGTARGAAGSCRAHGFRSARRAPRRRRMRSTGAGWRPVPARAAAQRLGPGRRRRRPPSRRRSTSAPASAAASMVSRVDRRRRPRRAAVEVARSSTSAPGRADLGQHLGAMNVWPPKPGSTVITSSMSKLGAGPRGTARAACPA